MKQKGLGRGLDAIFGGNIEVKAKPMSEMTEIALSKIVPNPTQPRTEFDEEALEELAESIRQLGLIQPITVKRDGDSYIIISGERRWRAAQKAGLEVIPAYIREVDDENLQICPRHAEKGQFLFVQRHDLFKLHDHLRNCRYLQNGRHEGTS